MTKVAIVGSHRGWDLDSSVEAQYAIQYCVESYIEEDPKTFNVVSGGAVFVDTWGAEAAKRENYEPIVHLPDRDKYGWPAAAFIRNKLIASDADIVYAYYSGQDRSPGTVSTVKYALEMGKPAVEWFRHSGYRNISPSVCHLEYGYHSSPHRSCNLAEAVV